MRNPTLVKFMVVAQFAACSVFAGAQVTDTAVVASAAQWQQDLSFLAARIEQMHPALSDTKKKEEFAKAVRDLSQQLPNLSREETTVRFMSLVASLQDGHTTIPASALPAAGMRLLPLRFYLYADGVYLQAADRRYQQVVGKKLIRIGDTPIDEAIGKLSGIVAHDNEATIRDRLPDYMIVPDLLVGLHIIPYNDHVSLTFEGDDRTLQVDATPVKGPEKHESPESDIVHTPDWVESAPKDTVPVWLKNRHKSYWMELLPDGKTLYVQYNQCTSDPQNPMPKFAGDVRTAASQQSVERAIIDLRLNSGGEGYWNKFLLLAVIRSTNIDQKSKLFVITGRRTFSAGSLLAIDLGRFTNAVFVGEPTGGAVQNFGNHEPVTLPNSKLLVMIATAFYQNAGPFDHRQWIAPEVAADLTHVGYQAGVDPALQAIESYVPAAQRLASAFERLQPAEIRHSYDLFKQDSINRYANLEPVLNDVGYKFLHAGDAVRAMQVFRIATEDFPGSANAFDSLGDAYATAGEKKLAVESYTRALKINPDWEPSRRSLQRLTQEPQPH
jgi:tetratricopeptide (TPR) repeat protein